MKNVFRILFVATLTLFVSCSDDDDNTPDDPIATNVDSFFIFHVGECSPGLTRPCGSETIRENTFEFVFNVYVDMDFAANTTITRTVSNESLDGFTLTSGGEALSSGQSVMINDGSLPLTLDGELGFFQDRIIFDAADLGTFNIQLTYETSNGSVEVYNYGLTVEE